MIWAVGVPGRQVPMAQKSPVVHALPSSQAFALFMKTQPVAGLQPSVVQALLSLHTRDAPGWQVPPEQLSPTVQASPSEQAFALFVETHPVADSHVSVVQGLLSLQTAAGPARHAPNAHTSPIVHALPSSQASVLFAKTQPVAGLQLSVVHLLPSSQTRSAPDWHTPPEQTSPTVQTFGSEQGFALFVYPQIPVAGSQLSLVQGLLSSQVDTAPGRHPPSAHWSPAVHGFPSSHAFVLFVKTQPVAGLQLSVVHALLSSQATGVPAHEPPEHVSPVVHAFRSEHAPVLFVWRQLPVAGSHVSLVHGSLSLHTVAVPGRHVPSAH